MMVIYTKQHLSNIWILIHENIKQNWGWVEKGVAYKKSIIKRYINQREFGSFNVNFLIYIHMEKWS